MPGIKLLKSLFKNTINIVSLIGRVDALASLVRADSARKNQQIRDLQDRVIKLEATLEVLTRLSVQNYHRQIPQQNGSSEQR